MKLNSFFVITPVVLIFFILLLLTIGSFRQLAPAIHQNAPPDPKVEKLKLQPGFHAQHLYSPSAHEHGSWVSMTFDDQGRMITSDQYGALYRIELPAIGADTTQKPKVEKLHIGDPKAPQADSIVNMGYAQGLLWAFNSLYVMINNHEDNEDFAKQSGLYRLQDTDQDDQYDKITLLKTLKGEGEHGPHSIVLAPDGKSLYVIAGNHTDVPAMDSYLLPAIWQEDNLFPLIKDPRGHATDRLPPGGWIARIDSLGKHWELVSAGFRNPFDLAFNQAGDLFTFDSDMEWDLGMPWYRPTRICHVTSGSEFGWRTGSGKWLPSYPDNLPAVLNIGQGSPTGVVHGKSAHFPEPYQQALFAFDWSFGIIYAIHLQPEGASYRAEKEEFLSGMPLPLTDGVIGPDGALYFLTGGRKLDSDLYRVYYDPQQQKEARSSRRSPKVDKAHQLRTRLEQFHGKKDKGAIEAAWPHLKHPDRFVRYAARIAVEHQPVAQWQQRVLTENDPQILIQGMVALSRQGDRSQKSAMLQKLLQVDYKKLSDEDKESLLRVFELIFSRMGKPEAKDQSAVIAYLNPHYPATTASLNRALSKLLVFLEAPQVIERTLALMAEEQPDMQADDPTATQSSDLILRNPQYGLDIAQMLENIPPAQHTYYAIVLSSLNKGWTPALREQYFKWFYKAFDFQGGRSYIGFIDKARELALEKVPKDKYEYYNKISGDSLLSNNGVDLANIPEPKGPGKNWKTEEAQQLLDSGLVSINFEQGKNMYAATLCVTCHSLRGEGGNIGPDLTQLGTRFSTEDMLEAIIDPNKVISDQYASTVFYLENGQSVVGRLINEDERTYYISQNPFAPDFIREIAKAEVKDTQFSSVSVMPPGLINSLNAQELKDLLAFLMAGGNQEHEIYTGTKTGSKAK